MGLVDDVKTRMEVHRALPVPQSESLEVEARAGRYGSQIIESIIPTKHLLADEGSYFICTNPTIGTAVAYGAQTSFSDTASGLFVIKNGDSPSRWDSKRIYLDYLRLDLTTAPASTVSMEFAVKLDNIIRVPTGGSATITPVNTNIDDTRVSVGQMYAFSAAAATVPASGAQARTVARAHISTSLGIVGDEYLIQFGGVDVAPSSGALTAARLTQPTRIVGNAAPVIIGPQQYAVIYMWWLTAGSAPSFEYEVTWFER